MFEDLSQNIQNAFQRFKGHKKLTEKDVSGALRDVRLALLSADVNYKVVRDFEKRIKERTLGIEAPEKLTSSQTVIKIVNEELTALMGGKSVGLSFSSQPPTMIMLVGLQGFGKTTSAGKLALSLKNQGKSVVLVAADVYRPAAIKQLQIIGEQIDIPVFVEETKDVIQISKDSLNFANRLGCEVVIIDTAGRMQIDELMMQELMRMKSAVKPHEILLVVDSMIGQEAVNIAKAFHESLGISGVILTKLDGDARGGAALSIKASTGCPVKFIGLGEKLDALEVFHPDRMASRILGMGDVLSLIEKAQTTFDEKTTRKMVKKIVTSDFTLADFLEQLQGIKKLGTFGDVLGMIPGFGALKKNLNGVDLDFDNKEFKHMEAIILSMTPKERENVKIIDAKGRKRIAQGSGTKVSDVNRLLKQFEEMRKMMRKLRPKQGEQSSSKRFKVKKKNNKKGGNSKFPDVPDLSSLLGRFKFGFPFK